MKIFNFNIHTALTLRFPTPSASTLIETPKYPLKISRMPLCSRCQKFDIQVFSRGTLTFRGYPLSAVVQAAAQENCSFCSMLVESLSIKDDQNDYTYLAEASRQQRGESLSLSRLSGPYRRLLYLRLKAALFPVWIHFDVERADDDDGEIASASMRPHSALQITGLRARVQPWISDRNGVSSGWTKPIFLHLAAEPG